jgi:hypothetical protein
MKFAGRSHAELSSLVDESVHLQVVGPSGSEFQVEVSAAWDDNPGQTLRLFFSVDDGGPRASPMKPLPNHSIERTATGKPVSAAHVERWAFRNRWF